MFPYENGKGFFSDPEREAKPKAVAQLAASIGRREVCTRCTQDIEWHGRTAGWLDRGAGNRCLPFIGRTEVVHPKGRHTAKPRPARWEVVSVLYGGSTENTWLIDGELETFATRAEARKALQEHKAELSDEDIESEQYRIQRCTTGA